MEIPGSTIRAYRERLQMTQRDFAKSLGMSQALISLVELGRGPVSKRLLQRLRAKGETGEFKPAFFDYLAEGGVQHATEGPGLDIQDGVVLEPWHSRTDLRKPGCPDGGRLYLPGLPEGIRAFRFNPPPRILGSDHIAVFRPAKLTDLVRDQVVLVQFKPQHGTKELPAGIAHLGRAVVVRKGRIATYQFEPDDQGCPVVNLEAKAVEVVMSRAFQGRFWP